MNQTEIEPTLERLPNATTVLVLGILAIAFSWMWGFPGLISGFLAIALGKKSKAMYTDNPEFYPPSAFSNIKTGILCAKIGIVLSAIMFLGVLIVKVLFGYFLNKI